MDIEIRAAQCGSNFCAKFQKQKQNNLLGTEVFCKGGINLLLMDVVKDWANIIEDIACRVDGVLILDCDVIDFDQTWGSTALGFGGCGGQMMTTARTYIIMFKTCAYVYLGGRFAYKVPIPFNKEFRDDLAKHSLAPIVASAKYWRTDGD